ncbi:Zinc finger transcription factor YY1 [Cocos nucifera]|uniref:Zinc finger transcription factor YY1 n=1 Tax=Cocos nucifera TaxID=13894 RepID=A0A8K0I076_COCNU|nr:Zinc finger transcription factor YY1 [Cocos nucifera]
MFERRPPAKDRTPAVRWFREWVPQEVVATGGKCSVLKWVTEDMLKTLREKSKEPQAEEPKAEPTTEVLFLCSYEGCGKSFIDVGALRKHAHIHGERQYVCHFEGCGKIGNISKSVEDKISHGSLALVWSRDIPWDTGMGYHPMCWDKAVLPAFQHPNWDILERSLSQSQMSGWDGIANSVIDGMKHVPPAEKLHSTPKTPAAAYGSASSERPYACPYEGCGKAYIHEYKLNLHLRREHPGHNSEENGKHAPAADHAMDEASDQDAYIVKRSVGKNNKRSSKTNLVQKMPPAKMVKRKGSNLASVNVSSVKKQWSSKEVYEEDSEETEEDRDNVEEDGWRYQGTNGDDEETEDED